MLLVRLGPVSFFARWDDGMMNSAGVFAVSNVRWTLIGVKWLEGDVSMDDVGAGRLSSVILARENGWASRLYLVGG